MPKDKKIDKDLIKKIISQSREESSNTIERDDTTRNRVTINYNTNSEAQAKREQRSVNELEKNELVTLVNEGS